MKRSKASSGSSKRPEHRPIGRRRSIEDDVLAVLIDERSGREYYVSMLDNFPYKGRAYSVMYNYEPDDGFRRDPEIIIMRSWRDDNGEQLFSSIRDRRELDAVFEVFFDRYAESLTSGS
ncbi:MAG: DUF1292 domain-containing protein [Saccharofermentanales bacterium]|jgi:hypothetical protein|nr:DUF1292 domain-containing protein [Eubacteriales bacterium]MDD3611934.1 DUF1292 domain-containing protein [Eubacteriales bacterium]HHU04431.1 DUF1292 domain-containing protein [Fastidiosipila sp.]